MHDLKDLDITEFTRSKEEGYFISSNAPSSGLFIKLERYKELEQRVKELEERIKKIPTSLSSLICEGYLENEVDARELEVVMMKLRHRLLTTNKDSK